MDRNKRQSLKTIIRRTVGGALSAIVMISGHVASAETDQLAIPLELANKLRPAEIAEGALDTPFFDAEKAQITISSLKGEGLVLNFWATWCAPCVREMPALDRLSAQLEGTGVRLITISEDRNALEKVPPFFAANNIQNLELFYDVKGALSRKLGVKGLPTTLLVNPDGAFVGNVLGTVEWDTPEIADYLVQTLAPKGPPNTN